MGTSDTVHLMAPKLLYPDSPNLRTQYSNLRTILTQMPYKSHNLPNSHNPAPTS